MPTSRFEGRAERKTKQYSYGIGDGTRRANGKRDERRDDGPGEADHNSEAEAAQPNGERRDDENDDDGRGEYDRGADAPEQVINVSPDQAIKLVITSNTDAIEAAKKGHPQDRITKFWSNFEPNYVGGVTQILPDIVGPPSTKATDKPQDPSLKASNSYESARNSCIKSVKRIIKECRANNKKYTDPHFDLERDLKISQNRDCLNGLTSDEDTYSPGDVKRVTDIFAQPQFFKDGAGFDDIVQGKLGDCWFLAGLSAVTSNQELLRKVCVIQDQDVGVYGFVFHRDGEWHPSIIDDKLYLNAPSFDETGEEVLEKYGVKQSEQEKLYQEILQKGSKALYFASCRDENETWVPLFEKAFAKAHGDYDAISGGQVGEAIEDLTGGVTTEIYTTNILSKEEYWRDLLRIGKDFIFSCGVAVFSEWRGGDYYESWARSQRLNGIISFHAYSVLSTYEGYGQRLVKIRNPWGQTEWSGAWSDGSKEWTPEWLYRLEHKFGDDGVFWMSYEDMLKKYKYMDRTRIIGPDWHVAQEWTSVQVPWSNRDYQSTTFSIDVPEDTGAVIVLSQLDDRYFKGFEGNYYFTLSFRVQKAGEDEDEDDYFARSPMNYELTRSTNVEVELEKGKYTVLFKVEARKNSKDDIETVIRNNVWRRDKITQIATLYDLAYKKGQPPKPEPKPEPPKAVEAAPVAPMPAVETKPAEVTSTEEKPVETTSEQKTEAAAAVAEETKKDDDKSEVKVEEKTNGETLAVNTNGEITAEKTNGETTTEKPAESTETKTDSPAAATESTTTAAAAATPPTSADAAATTAPPQANDATQPQPEPVPVDDGQIVPDDRDPQRNPWNASCVVGLRVYSKISTLKLKVVRPGDKDGIALDRDDIASAPLAEAEKKSEEVKPE